MAEHDSCKQAGGSEDVFSLGSASALPASGLASGSALPASGLPAALPASALPALALALGHQWSTHGAEASAFPEAGKRI